ncbi:MAG TPA: FAD-dependent oxidoreductase [Alphaproteobacteria bacterium]|nr:FAD-dependent oxidoreductase [Alphaproteobacteria bacterium]
MSGLKLAHGLAFEALYTREGCLRLDALFCERLKGADTALFDRLMAGRADPESLAARDEGELLIALAPHLEDFLAELFGIEAELAALEAVHEALAPLFTCKRLFVQRDASRAHKEAEAASFDGDALRRALDAHLGAGWDELAFATKVMAWREAEADHAEALDLARRYAAWALHSEAGRTRHRDGVLFKMPHKTDPYHLVPVETETVDGHAVMRVNMSHAPRREGFDLTDPGADLTLGLDDVNYCIWCHTQNKDSCSKGLKEKQGEGFRKSVFGVTLAGCPLEEKISEMHTLKASGHPLGALAVICVDNPLCAATGHRVCNDCMKACVYQRQEPVNIPRSESRILKDAIELPWGVEIYGLLGRWNPLNLRRPVPKPPTGRKVLVVGLGPAGFNLAHHLLNEGHSVVAIDGLKIEPLDHTLSGVTPEGKRVAFRPVERFADIRERLDERTLAGFGGLSEYGITVRWDKNYLKVIRLLLERRAEFAMYGGVRFGGTIDVDGAWALGFDHIALCIGAGRPTMLEVPNGLARGVRAANDFLMALQLGGAGKTESLTDLQLRLPVVVIGGGLTAGDTATESLAYYPIQVEKFLARYEALAAERGEAAVRAGWGEEERCVADEFIAHARAIRAERAAAAREGRAPRIRELVDSWGGVTIAYRRRLIDSPSYTLNHEEVEKAMEEGVRFAECLAPEAVELDQFGHAAALRMRRTSVGADGKLAETGESVTLPARAILVAAGTQPNTVLADEDPRRFRRDGRYLQAIDEAGRPVKPERVSKPQQAELLVHLDGEGRGITAFGDLHASFAGNVVKAMASAKHGAALITRLLARRPPAAAPSTSESFFAGLDAALRPRVAQVTPLAPGFVEIAVTAPLAARAWRPGQFFRLQNFEALAQRRGGTPLAMEGVAAFPAAVDPARGLVSLVLATDSGSRRLAALLAPGEPVALMGPNGVALELPEQGTMVFAGEGFGCAALVPLSAAARSRGLSTVILAAFARADAVFKQAEIEAVADRVLWLAGSGPAPAPRRPQDAAMTGDLAAALGALERDANVAPLASLPPVARVVVLGPDEAIVSLRSFGGDGTAEGVGTAQRWGAIVAPMQCMMKEVCARCLQPVRNPATGKSELVFACAHPHQPLADVDLAALAARLGQNRLQENLTSQWLARLLP